MADYYDAYEEHRDELARFLVKHQKESLERLGYEGGDHPDYKRALLEVSIMNLAQMEVLQIYLKEINLVSEREWTVVRFSIHMPLRIQVSGMVYLSGSEMHELNRIYLNYFKQIHIHTGSSLSSLVPDIKDLDKLTIDSRDVYYTAKGDPKERHYFFG